MTAIDRIKVLVLHPDPIAQAGLSFALGRCPDVEVLDDADYLAGSRGMLHSERASAVDVVVADHAGGISLAAEIVRRCGPAGRPKVVIVASTDREWEIRKAVEKGVRGYLLAGCPLDELCAGIRAVHRGMRFFSPEVTARLAESVAGEALTGREEEVLSLVVEGLCNKAISRKLGIAVGTVKSHLKSTFDKLQVESRTQAVAAVERRGLLCEVRARAAASRMADEREPANVVRGFVPVQRAIQADARLNV